MTRIFTTWFDFESQSYMALVTMVVKDSENVSFFVAIDHPMLLDMIPEGRLVFNTIGGMLLPAELKDDRTCDLVLQVSLSIMRHLTTFRYPRN